MKVQYFVDRLTAECGTTSAGMDFKEAVKLAKETASHYGSAILEKRVWKERRIVKHEALLLKADGSFSVLYQK